MHFVVEIPSGHLGNQCNAITFSFSLFPLLNRSSHSLCIRWCVGIQMKLPNFREGLELVPMTRELFRMHFMCRDQNFQIDMLPTQMNFIFKTRPYFKQVWIFIYLFIFWLSEKLNYVLMWIYVKLKLVILRQRIIIELSKKYYYQTTLETNKK